MNSHFAVREFQAATDKASSIYQRCTSNSGSYKDLAKCVGDLQIVLSEIQEFASASKIPNDELKVRSLVAAGYGCYAILEEADDFLKKHAGTKADLDLHDGALRFTTQDVEDLKTKLSHITALLRLCLASLTRLSTLELQLCLEEILNDHQHGIREPSIVSSALVDNMPVSEDELLDHLAIELEDKNVHPDSIALNRDFILSWISSRNIEQSSASISSFKINTDSDAEKTPSETDETHVEQVPERHSITTLESYRSYASEEDQSIQPDEDSIFSPTSIQSGSISSTVSLSSPITQPEDPTPKCDIDTEDTFSMLCDMVQVDSTDLLPAKEAKPKIIRAFRQQDWTHRGYLTRSETNQLCSDILKRSGIEIDRSEVDEIVRASDVNQDGHIDEMKFIGVMRKLIKASIGARTKIAREKLEYYASTTRRHHRSYINNLLRIRDILPWGWTANRSEEGTVTYFDHVRDVLSERAPKAALGDATFTSMAIQAEFCVEIIDNFERNWLRLIPQHLHSRYSETLARARTAALEFVVFENSDEKFGRKLSNLDTIYLCFKIITIDNTVKLPVPTKYCTSLEKARGQALDCLRSIQGFVLALALIDHEASAANSEGFASLHNKWKQQQMQLMAREITQKAEIWPTIRSTIAVFSTFAQEAIERSAVERVQMHLVQMYEIRDSLQPMLWEASISTVAFSRALSYGKKLSKSLNMKDARDVVLRIKVDNPNYETLSDEKAKWSNEGSWAFSEGFSNVCLMPSSRISYEVLQYKGGAGGNLTYSYDDILYQGDFDEANMDYLWLWARTKPGERICLKHQNGDFTIRVFIKLSEQRDIAEQLAGLEERKWYHFILDSIGDHSIMQKTSDDTFLPGGNRPKSIDANGATWIPGPGMSESSESLTCRGQPLCKGLPPGWHTAGLAERSYYVDHNTRTTTWECPGCRNLPPKYEMLRL